MSGARHRLVLASAGTGKTYQLAGHFLRLLFAGVPQERVLATTFTRKAAGEILDRVLGRLLAALRSAQKLAELAASAGRPVSEAECVALLARLARGLDRFQVRTLDSFFVHVARLFALDLGLPPDWTLVDEQTDDELRAAALGRVLADCAPEERVELLRGLQREAASRSVHAAMLRVVERGRSAFLDSVPEAWEGAAARSALSADELARLGARLAAIGAPLTKTRTPVQSWVKNLAALGAAADAGDWPRLLSNGLSVKLLGGEETFDRHPISAELREVLAALAGHAAAELLRLVALETAAARRFLERFEAAYGALKRERGAYRFEDLPLALSDHERQSDEARTALWFRLDGRLDHLLLDEFQDTAPVQWRALAPLADEVLADGTGERSFFCVGDVKQSIYGWREAEPRLLANLHRRYPVLEPEQLYESYRSSQVVLDAVNGVFQALGGASVFDGDEHPSWRAAADAFRDEYPAHRAAVDMPGAAVLLQASFASDEETPRDAALRAAVERVAALAAEAPRATIGVLVRARRPIPRLLFELRRRGVRASGEGGNPLTDAESVQVFLSALHIADHPGDGAAAFHVATSPLAAAFGLSRETDAPAAARALRADLVRRGYGRVATELMRHVERAPAFGDWDRGRFRQLVDLAHAHDARAGLSPSEFVRLVRETPVQDPTAARVRVMTIHASKGLEFDAVVLPELDQKLTDPRVPYLFARPDPFGAIERVSARPAAALLQFSGELRELQERVEAREVRESLCVLYVAMTRAARRLELIVPPSLRSGNESAAHDSARLLRETLGARGKPGAAGEPDAPGELWRHPASSADWHSGCAGGDQEGVELEPGAPERASLGLAPTSRPRALSSRSPSVEAEHRSTAAELLRSPASRSASRGTLVHRWLEELEWLDDFDVSDERLLDLGAALEPDEAARRAALALLRRALEQGELRALLTRPGDGRVREVCREQRLAQVLAGADGTEVLWTGAIDRLVLVRAGDRVEAAEVIDYKTDAIGAAELREHAERYRPQLEAYCRLVALAYRLPRVAVRAHLAFLGPGRVLESRGSDQPS